MGAVKQVRSWAGVGYALTPPWSLSGWPCFPVSIHSFCPSPAHESCIVPNHPHLPQGNQAGEGLAWMGAQLVRPGSARATALAATATAQAAADTTARLADAVTQARELHARAAQLRAAMDEVGLLGFGFEWFFVRCTCIPAPDWDH